MSKKPGNYRKRNARRAVIARDGEKCARCGATEQLTLDHVVPRAHGGTNGHANLQLLCDACNNLKGSEMPWLPFAGLLRRENA